MIGGCVSSITTLVSRLKDRDSYKPLPLDTAFEHMNRGFYLDAPRKAYTEREDLRDPINNLRIKTLLSGRCNF